MSKLFRNLALVVALLAGSVSPSFAAFGGQRGATFTGTGASGNAAVTITAATAGDLLFCAVTRSVTHTSGGAWGTPSGWTQGQDSGINVGNLAAASMWKIAAGGETSFAPVGTNEAGSWTAACVAIEGPFETSPMTASNEDVTHIGANTVTQDSGFLNTTALNTVNLAFFGIDSGANFGSTRTYTNSFTELGIVTSGGRAGTTIAMRVATTGLRLSTTLAYSVGGTTDEMYGGMLSFVKDGTGSAPTIAANTADAATLSQTAALEATCTDGDGDSCVYQFQIADNTDFNGTQVVTVDSYEGGGTSQGIHPQPSIVGGPAFVATWEGNPQTDDRPMQSVSSNGGGFLYSLSFNIGNDQTVALSGKTRGRVWSHSALGAAKSVTIVQVTGTATATSVAHGYTTGDFISINGSTIAAYNGSKVITVTSADTYTFAIAGGTATPATGTITSAKHGPLGVEATAFGVSSAPLNSVSAATTPTHGWLAQTDDRTWNDSESASQTWYEQLFTSTNAKQLVPSTKYLIGADWVPDTTISAVNTISFNADLASATHAGNGYIDGISANWGVRQEIDLWFRWKFTQTTYQDAQSDLSGTFANTVTGGDTTPFNTGEKVRLTSASLSTGITYYWRVRAVDSAGSGVYSAWSTARSFTVTAAGATTSNRGLLLGVGPF